MRYEYKLNSLDESLAIISYLLCVGASSDLKGGSISQAKEYYKDYPYIVLTVEENSISIGGNCDSKEYTKKIKFNDIFKIKLPKKQSVKLNNEHTALITPKEITVGCKTFPLSIIDDLVLARDKVLN